MSSVPQQDLDPYTAKAQNENISPQEKISDLHAIMKSAPVCMLTTRAADGEMHSRAMQACAPTSDSQLNLAFIANNASHKFEELNNDVHVNASFCDQSSTNWASFCGKARITQDQAVIDKFWSPQVTAYFGDLKDGKHNGKANDPRVSVIELVPHEIRYWKSTQGSVRRAANEMISATTGNVAAPGELRTITRDEIALVEGLNKS